MATRDPPDPEYLAFLEELTKPEEALPSAEVQLERREAEEKAALGALTPPHAAATCPVHPAGSERYSDAKAANQPVRVWHGGDRENGPCTTHNAQTFASYV